MCSVSRADVLCLTLLFCLDLNVWAWWRLHHQPTAPDTPAVIGTVTADPQTGVPTTDGTADEVMPTSEDGDAGGRPYLRWQHTYGDYWLLVTRSGEFDEKLQVFQRGQLVFEMEDHKIYDPEETDNANDTTNRPPLFRNLLGTGVPCLVIASFSGGVHCCSQYDVLTMGETFRHVARIDAQHGEATFKDVDGDNVAEIKLNDWSYAYVFTSFAGSPAPEAILRYRDGKYVPAPELLFTQSPTTEEFTALVEETCAAYSSDSDKTETPGNWGSNVTLWRTMLELTYKGHLERAMELFEQCWPAEWSDKEKAHDEFWDAVGRSEYGRVVVEAQGFSLPPSPNEEAEPSTGDTP